MTLRVTHVLRRIDASGGWCTGTPISHPPTSVGPERGQGAAPDLTVTLAAPPATAAPVR
jgi:hypothetical protein